MTAYYNEYDPYAAQWLRNLIEHGHIAPGYVDERSIEDIVPSDLIGFTQCHFFAGIGIWSLALRNAGWPDDRPIWTGSCPCQPFSKAGARVGFADERHLWPAWFHLIEQWRPSTIFGEQVDGNDGFAWLDLVQTDLEALEYAIGPVVLPAASVGAPHGRHRIFFVADAVQSGRAAWRTQSGCGQASGSGELVRLADSDVSKPDGGRPSSREQPLCDERGERTSAVEYAESEQARVSRFARERRATGGFWSNADWIPCRDGAWRPIEPGTFPLAHGHTRRMDKLRAFGNAIVPQAAEAFIRAYL